MVLTTNEKEPGCYRGAEGFFKKQIYKLFSFFNICMFTIIYNYTKKKVGKVFDHNSIVHRGMVMIGKA